MKDDERAVAERRQIFKLASAVSDIRAAHQAAQYAAEKVDDMYHALWAPLQDAIVISYVRPFTANKPHGPLPEKWSKFESRLQERIHADLIGLRHRVVAHSDGHVRQVIVVPSGVSYVGGRRSEGVGFAVTSDKLFPDKFAEITDHCQELGSRLYGELRSELERAFTSPETPRYPFDLITGEREDLPGGVILRAEMHDFA
jgi:hypothetical protein